MDFGGACDYCHVTHFPSAFTYLGPVLTEVNDKTPINFKDAGPDLNYFFTSVVLLSPLIMTLAEFSMLHKGFGYLLEYENPTGSFKNLGQYILMVTSSLLHPESSALGLRCNVQFKQRTDTTRTDK